MPQLARIRIDYDKCVGSRLCTSIAPKVFELNHDGQAMVANAKGDDLKVIQTAAEACPVSAIIVELTDEK